MTDTLMTSEAATTTEGQATSTTTETAPATAAETTSQTQAPAAQTAEATVADATKTEGEPEGAPESYEFKAPEGKEYDPDVIAEFTKASKELNLSNESAQKMLDSIAPALAAKAEASIAAARTQWEADTKADKEVGGDQLDQSLATAKKALETFGTPELCTLLNDSGLGNHPEIIRAFWKAGKAISEDGFVSGSGGNTAAPSVAQRMYPNMNP